MSSTNVLSSHHEIINIGRIKAAEWGIVAFTIAFILLPVLETKIVVRITWVVETERSPIFHNSVIELCMIADIVLSQDVIALVALEFSLRGNVGHPVELKISLASSSSLTLENVP
jgi:hypothetical protein